MNYIWKVIQTWYGAFGITKESAGYYFETDGSLVASSHIPTVQETVLNI